MKKESFTLLPYEPYRAYELTNEGQNSYIPYKDMKRYVKSLKKFKCRRTLVVSYESNLWNQKRKKGYRDLLAKNDISVEVKGEIPL
jgi:predicted DNA-binding WGR domain protein